MMGKKVRDKITGFEGIVTAEARYLYSNEPQYRVEAPAKDGKMESEWFYPQRLETVNDDDATTDV